MRLPSPDFESPQAAFGKHFVRTANALTATILTGHRTAFALNPNWSRIASSAHHFAPPFGQTGTAPEFVPSVQNHRHGRVELIGRSMTNEVE